MADDGFHEIQLSGKQLVFLLMATTIVSVVIFLFGVLVGRGVRNDAAGTAASLDAPITGEAAPASETAASAATAAAAAAPAAGELSYYERLGGGAAPATEALKTPPPPPADEAPADPPRAAAKTPPPIEKQPTSSGAAPPPPAAASPLESGAGWTIQVMVLERAQAEALVKRLSQKGYPAYLSSQVLGSTSVRVRVGRYQERREVDEVAARLKKEEQFTPWVTR